MNEQKLHQMERELLELRKLLTDLNALLRGAGAEGGMVHSVLTLGAVVHGTNENPGGLVRRISEVEDTAVQRASAVEKVALERAASLEQLTNNKFDRQGEKIDRLYKIVWMGLGGWSVIMGVCTVVWMVFSHFHK